MDAMLGTGLDRPVAGDWREAIELANALECRGWRWIFHPACTQTRARCMGWRFMPTSP